jgi:hypothetical protein
LQLNVMTLKGNDYMKKLLLAVALGLGFALSMAPAPSSAQVIIRVGPPAARYEVRPVRPAPGYVWVGGYWGWAGGQYVWRRGYWSRHAGNWCGGHWVNGYRRGWHWVPGRWC